MSHESDDFVIEIGNEKIEIVTFFQISNLNIGQLLFTGITVYSTVQDLSSSTFTHTYVMYVA